MPCQQKGTIARLYINYETRQLKHTATRTGTHSLTHTHTHLWAAFTVERSAQENALTDTFGLAPSATHVENSCGLKAFSLSPAVKPKRKPLSRALQFLTHQTRGALIHKQPISLPCCRYHVTSVKCLLNHRNLWRDTTHLSVYHTGPCSHLKPWNLRDQDTAELCYKIKVI